MSSGKVLGFAAGLRHARRNSAGPPPWMISAVLSVEPLSTTTIRRRRSAHRTLAAGRFDPPSSGISTAARRRAMSSAFFAIPDARIRRLRAGKPLRLDAFGKSGRGSPVALDTTGGKGFEPPVLPRNDIVFERRGTSTIQLYLEESTARSRIRGAGRGWHTRAHSRQAPLWDNRRRRRHLRGQLCIARFNSVRTFGQPHAADRLPERASRFCADQDRQIPHRLRLRAGSDLRRFRVVRCRAGAARRGHLVEPAAIAGGRSRGVLLAVDAGNRRRSAVAPLLSPVSRAQNSRISMACS